MRKFNTIDTKEIYAASITVMDAHDGHSELSGYVGTATHGGPMVRNFEAAWRDTFGVNYAVSVNSATSGLLAACMAIGIVPGDEVIVSPYTMSATAAAPKLLGANIVFADIEDDSFCLDPASVAEKITPKTVVVIVTNLFGCPARLHELRALCDEKDIYLIEDNAQAIFAKEFGKFTGTIGHIGVFSLNVHKQIQVGEGGVVVTNIEWLDGNLREAMNHGEMRGGIIGLNLRMTEVTAAMACEQLRKAERIIGDITSYAKGINHYIDKLDLPIIPHGMRTDFINRTDCVHSYYCWAGLIVEHDKINISPPFKRGYMRPLYELPAFKQDISLPKVEGVEKDMILMELCSISPTVPNFDVMVGNLRRTK
jgi:perosamine synthetase